jgi:FMN phosphatase YigB (HAD superfamily)
MNKMFHLSYNVIAFDSGGVLHETSYDKHNPYKRSMAIDEMRSCIPLLESLSNQFILVLVCNSTKTKIIEMMKRSGIGIYFDKMYIAPKNRSKVQRLERVMKDFKTNKIILLDDKLENVNEALNNGISAIQITHDDLLKLI